MNFIWLFYWLLLISSLIFSIYVIIKKNKLLGGIQGALTIVFSIYTFVYVMHRDFINKEYELEFIIKNILKKEMGAILVVVLLISLIGIFIYNLFSLKKDTKFAGGVLK